MLHPLPMHMLQSTAHIDEYMNDLLLLHFAVVLHDQIEKGAALAKVAEDHDAVTLLLDAVDADNILMVIDLLPDLHFVLYLRDDLLRFVLRHHLFQGEALTRARIDHLVHEGEAALAQKLFDEKTSSIEVNIPILWQVTLHVHQGAAAIGLLLLRLVEVAAAASAVVEVILVERNLEVLLHLLELVLHLV